MKNGFVFSFFLLIGFVQAQPSYEFPFEDFRCSQHWTYKNNEANRSDTVNILNYSIYLDFTEAENEELLGHCMITFRPEMDINSLHLDLLKLTVDSVIFHGDEAKYEANENEIRIDFSITLERNKVDSVRIHYHGKPALDQSGFGGFYFTDGYYFNMGVAFTDQPHVYGRSWHPCFDNFSERATYDFSILTKKGFTAYCVGTRTFQTDLDKKTSLSKWKLETEIPSYLAAIYVSNYKHFEQMYSSEVQQSEIPIWLVAQPQDMSNFKSSFRNLTTLMAEFEDRFGPYNWEKIGFALVPFDGGAMEHATLIAYPKDDADGSLDHEDLMAHELSHHWWGNWVTCASPEEMWINEGMASYCEYLFYEALYGRVAYMELMRKNHYMVLQKAHYYDGGHYALNKIPADYTYGVHSYKKGADVMHTLRSYMGDERFFKGLKHIQSSYGNGNISTEEFRDVMVQFSANAGQFFDDWILQPGGAHFSVEGYSSTLMASLAFKVDVRINQKSRAATGLFQKVPLNLSFISKDFDVFQEQIEVSGADVRVSIDVPFEPVYVGINLDERISDATTAKMEMISKKGNYDWKYANVNFNAKNVKDSALIRIEHNWVGADAANLPEKIQISKERYWNIDGVHLENLDGEIDFHYSGQMDRDGFLDFQLFTYSNATNQNLVLLYRSANNQAWTIHPDFILSHEGPKNSTKGKIKAKGIKKGQYAIGYRLE